MGLSMNERRAQDDTARLARLVLRDQLEKAIGLQTQIVQTTIEEFRDGDPGLLEIFREKSLH
jgi:hypothetical protein